MQTDLVCNIKLSIWILIGNHSITCINVDTFLIKVIFLMAISDVRQ